MNFNAVFRNVRKHGIRGTLQIRRQRIEAQKEKDRRDRLCTWYHDCAFERPFLRLGDDARAEYMERIYAVEKELKELRPKTLKRMKKENKARYLKEVIPACYAEHAAKPVEDKIRLFSLKQIQFGKLHSISKHWLKNFHSYVSQPFPSIMCKPSCASRQAQQL